MFGQRSSRSRARKPRGPIKTAVRQAGLWFTGPITRYLNERAAARFYNQHEPYPGAEYALAQPPERAS